MRCVTSAIHDFIFGKLKIQIKKTSTIVCIILMCTLVFSIISLIAGIAALLRTKQGPVILVPKTNIVFFDNQEYIPIRLLS